MAGMLSNCSLECFSKTGTTEGIAAYGNNENDHLTLSLLLCFNLSVIHCDWRESQTFLWCL